MRLLAILLAIVVLLAGAAYAAAPLFAFYELKTAAQTGNAGQMSAVVDFPSVRANLKTDLAARLNAAMSRNPQAAGSPLAGQVSLIGQAIIDRVVDANVTPEGVGDLIRTAKAPALDAVGGPSAADSGAKVRTGLGYADLLHFRITLSRGDKADARVGLLLEQKSPFLWKLTHIELPPEPAQSAAGLPPQPVTEAVPIGEGASSDATSGLSVAVDPAQPASGAAFGPTLAGGAPPMPPQGMPAPQAMPPAPAGPPRPVRRPGPAPGSDAYICAHGDPNSDFTIQACDRRTLGR
jgi:hypothetical protein